MRRPELMFGLCFACFPAHPKPTHRVVAGRLGDSAMSQAVLGSATSQDEAHKERMTLREAESIENYKTINEAGAGKAAVGQALQASLRWALAA